MILPRDPDPELVRRARAGERSAISALIERHYPTLVRCCRRALRDPDLARDAAQEASLNAMLGLGRLRDDERFGAWLIGIGLNVCRGLLRTRHRTLPLERADSPPPFAGPGPEEHAERSDIADRVRAAVATLPPGQRQAVELFYIDGLTHAEAAEELGTRPGAVKTRLHKARRSLRAPLNNIWKEYFAMDTELVPMHIADLRRTAGTDPERHIVFLEEDGGERQLQIWIGQPEASSLAVIMEDVELPRPGPHHFAASLLSAAGSGLREVRIVELSDFTFYAQAVLEDGTTVDARPSDALTVAVLTGAPIVVAPAVLEQAALSRRELGDLYQEAEQATDHARTIAAEAKERSEASTARLRDRR